MNQYCSACSIKVDINSYKKDETVCRICYNKNKNKRKNKNNTSIQNKTSASYQQPKTENGNINNNKNRTLVIRFSNCVQNYLLNHIVHQKEEPIFIITKSLYHHPNIEAQTSSEIQPLENYVNSIVVFDDMLLSNKTTTLISFLQEVATIILIFITYVKANFFFHNLLFIIILI